MEQTLIVLGIIAAAAGYLGWRAWSRLAATRRAKAGGGNCGPDCGCG